jgi:hypothetical protein
MTRPQRNTKRSRHPDEEETRETDAAVKLRSSARHSSGKEAASPASVSSPYAQRERRSKHFGDDEVGGISALIPKSRKTESPGKPAARGVPAPSPRGRAQKSADAAEAVRGKREQAPKQGKRDNANEQETSLEKRGKGQVDDGQKRKKSDRRGNRDDEDPDQNDEGPMKDSSRRGARTMESKRNKHEEEEAAGAKAGENESEKEEGRVEKAADKDAATKGTPRNKAKVSTGTASTLPDTGPAAPAQPAQNSSGASAIGKPTATASDSAAGEVCNPAPLAAAAAADANLKVSSEPKPPKSSSRTASAADSGSPALTAMAAVAAAATLARAMAEAQKELSPRQESTSAAGSAGTQHDETSASLPQASQAMAAAAAAVAGAAAAAAAAGVNPAVVSQAMMQQAQQAAAAGFPSGGLVPVGWAAQGMAGALGNAMAGLNAHQLALQKWAHMAGAPIPVGVALPGADASMPNAQAPASSLQGSAAAAASWQAMHQYASLSTPPIPAPKLPGAPPSPHRTHQPCSTQAQAQAQAPDAQAPSVHPSSTDAQNSSTDAQTPTPSAHTPLQPSRMQHEGTHDDKRQKAASGVAETRKLVMWMPVDDALLKAAIEGGMSLSDIAEHMVINALTTQNLKARA